MLYTADPTRKIHGVETRHCGPIVNTVPLVRCTLRMEKPVDPVDPWIGVQVLAATHSLTVGDAPVRKYICPRLHVAGSAAPTGNGRADAAWEKSTFLL